MYLLSHPNPFLIARIRILDTSINRCWYRTYLQKL
jgi:hypothetical protein